MTKTTAHSATPTTTPVAEGARQTTYREALREAHRDALARDPRVFLMGEDVGRYGGSFAVSLGLLEEFGPDGSATPRCPSRHSPAPESEQRSAGCARSSRS